MLSLYYFGACCLKIRDACMDFEPYFKVQSLVSVHPKSIKLGQMTNLNVIFRVSRKLRPRNFRPQTSELENSDLETSDLENSDLENSDPLQND